MTIPTHGGRAVEAEPHGEAHATAPPPHHPVSRRRDRAVAAADAARPPHPPGCSPSRAARGAGARGLRLRHGVGHDRRPSRASSASSRRRR